VAYKDFYVTPSGSTAHVTFLGVDNHPDRDAERYTFSVQSPAGNEETLNVMLVSPALINRALQQNGLPPLVEVKKDLTRLAAVTNFDRLDFLPTDEGGRRLVAIEGPEAIALLRRSKLSDREIRRFIARRIYQVYSRSTLNETVLFDHFDHLLTGAEPVDLYRNAQVLEAEGYVIIKQADGLELRLQPTVRLVREVERYGAAKEDVVTDSDYVQALGAYPGLGKYREAMQLEYQRYAVAVTDTELESVFKAAAPIVEAIVKDLLRAHGSTQQHTTLGPAVADLAKRGIGGRALLSQLDHVLKFGRDLALHGADLPTTVLRIACANAFELAPQLGALFPRAGSVRP
jgi:hypothetical protein